MIDGVRQLIEGLGETEEENEGGAARLGPLWAAAAQLLLATGAGATIEQLSSALQESGDSPAPPGLAWAPAIVSALAATASLEHARRPTERSETAVRFLNSATIGFGAALFAFDAFVNRGHPPRRIAPLAFASAGALALLLDRAERDVEDTERDLERRARVVERLVPQRKPKLDRIVVHV